MRTLRQLTKDSLRSDRRLRLLVKRVLFPGIDIHARCRAKHLPRHFERGSLYTLDAGCGNGSLSLPAHRRGSHVIAISMDGDEIKRAGDYFDFLGVPSSAVRFETLNLYDVSKHFEPKEFDQIICSETLEHIYDDHAIVRAFSQLLKPGGVLHVCSPNAEHPDHALGRKDEPEDGRHVRDGYTLDSYRALLEPEGFDIVEVMGIGNGITNITDKIVRMARERIGHIVAIPLFLLLSPLRLLDRPTRREPYSLYVRALRKIDSDGG